MDAAPLPHRIAGILHRMGSEIDDRPCAQLRAAMKRMPFLRRSGLKGAVRDLNEVFVFVTVVDQKGFSSASCALKLPKLPTKLDEPVDQH
jgi:hypothetical protein